MTRNASASREQDLVDVEWTDGSHVRSGIFLPAWWLLGCQNGPCPVELVKNHWTQMTVEVCDTVYSGKYLSHLGGTCCLHRQARIVPYFGDGCSSSSETSINFYEIILRHVPEESDFGIQHCLGLCTRADTQYPRVIFVLLLTLLLPLLVAIHIPLRGSSG